VVRYVLLLTLDPLLHAPYHLPALVHEKEQAMAKKKTLKKVKKLNKTVNLQVTPLRKI
jgi:hypothetical protein